MKTIDVDRQTFEESLADLIGYYLEAKRATPEDILSAFELQTMGLREEIGRDGKE